MNKFQIMHYYIHILFKTKSVKKLLNIYNQIIYNQFIIKYLLLFYRLIHNHAILYINHKYMLTVNYILICIILLLLKKKFFKITLPNQYIFLFIRKLKIHKI